MSRYMLSIIKRAYLSKNSKMVLYTMFTGTNNLITAKIDILSGRRLFNIRLFDIGVSRSCVCYIKVAEFVYVQECQMCFAFGYKYLQSKISICFHGSFRHTKSNSKM